MYNWFSKYDSYVKLIYDYSYYLVFNLNMLISTTYCTAVYIQYVRV